MTKAGDTIQNGVFLPSWFLAGVLAAFLSTSIAIGWTAIQTWSDVNANKLKNDEQDRRLANLESLPADNASTKADIATMKEMLRDINEKLDRRFEGRGKGP